MPDGHHDESRRDQTPGGLWATVMPAVVHWLKGTRLNYERKSWATPDPLPGHKAGPSKHHDFIDIDWLPGSRVPDKAHADRPLVVAFHGLNGSSQSHYIVALMQAVNARGWRGAVVNFRGCGGRHNRAPRAYHSGDHTEINWILARFKSCHAPSAPLFAAGYSLGANALLRWTCELKGDTHRYDTNILAAAAAVSAPTDLYSSAVAYGQGFTRLLQFLTVRRLKREAREIAERASERPAWFDPVTLRRICTVYEFDNVFTAPAHALRDAEKYYRDGSSIHRLRATRVPTFILTARNDPIARFESRPGPDDIGDSGSISYAYPPDGGHCGFATGRFPFYRFDDAPGRVLDFFALRANNTAGGDSTAA